MNNANMRNEEQNDAYFKVSMKMTTEERSRIDHYFSKNPRMLRGETFKDWIMSGVRRWESSQEQPND